MAAGKRTKKQRLQQAFAAWLVLMLAMATAAAIAAVLGGWQLAAVLGGIWALMAGCYLVWWRSMPRRAGRVLRDVFSLDIPPWFLPWTYRRHEHGIRSWVFHCPTPVISTKLLMAYEYIAEHLDADPDFENVGRSRFRMEVATKKLPERIHFHDFHRDQEPPQGDLVFPIGESRGAPVWADLGGTGTNNLLVAGATGTGKSAALRQKIVWMMRHYEPGQLRFVLVDLAAVEFNIYEGLPHLFWRVATDLESTLIALEQIKAEERRRKILYAEVPGVTKLQEYNEWAEAHDRPTLPYIMLVVDEWALVSPKDAVGPDDKSLRSEITAKVNDIARTGRKFGFPVVLATQRPDKDTVDGQTKANIQNRLCGGTTSPVQSRVVLDNDRAAVLPEIKGRMIWQSGRREQVVQVPLLEPAEAVALLSTLKSPKSPAISVLPAAEEAGLPALDVL